MQCPLCLSFQFASLRALRDALINCAQRPVSCPLCADSLRGLDKFTAHLFAHLLSGQTAAQGHWLDACAASPEQTDDEDSLMSLLRCRGTLPEITVDQEAVVEVNDSHVDDSQEAAVAGGGGQETVDDPPDGQVTVTGTPVVESAGSAEGMILEAECDGTGSEPPPSVEDGDDVGAKRPFACFRCSKAFRSRGSLLVHMRIAHNAPRGAQLQLVTPAPAPTPTPTPTDGGAGAASHGKAWECATCRKRFSTKYFLAKHQRLHTGETPYACATCGKSFTFQQSLHKHLLYHSAVKPHACPDCGRCFKELSTLANHRRIHSGEKPFPCETCGKRFRQRVSWLVHRRIHTGALPYQCTSCGQRFRYKVSQRTHKCPAQPPGAVVRAPSDLLARLKAAQSTGTQAPLQQLQQEAPLLHHGLLDGASLLHSHLDAPTLQRGPHEAALIHHGTVEAPSLRLAALESASLSHGLPECPVVHQSLIDAQLLRLGPLENSGLRQGLVENLLPSQGQRDAPSLRQGFLDAASSQQSLLESSLRRASDFPILRTIDEESLRQLLDSTTL